MKIFLETSTPFAKHLTEEHLSRILNDHVDTLITEWILCHEVKKHIEVLRGLLVELITHGNLQKAALLYKEAQVQVKKENGNELSPGARRGALV